MIDTVNEFIATKQAEGRAESTIYEYRLYLIAFDQHCNHKPLAEITNIDCVAWLTIEKAKGLRPATLLARWRALKVFFRWAVEHDHLTKSPLKMKAPKQKKEEPRAANYDDVQRLLTHPVTTWQDYRNRALVHLLLDTGMRIGEAVSLQLTHVDFDNRLVHIPAGKDGESRIVPFTSACAATIQAYLCARPSSRYDEWLFVGSRRHGVAGRLTVTGARGMLQRWCQAAGVPYINPHSLRHLFATRILNNGLRVEVVSKLLGHFSVDLTLRIYARLRTDVITREYRQHWGD